MHEAWYFHPTRLNESNPLSISSKVTEEPVLNDIVQCINMAVVAIVPAN